MINFKEDKDLMPLNHSCAHVMAQAVKHLYPEAKFWVGPVVEEGFYYDMQINNKKNKYKKHLGVVDSYTIKLLRTKMINIKLI